MNRPALSDTLQEGLEAYRIGPKVRALRLAKDLGLAQLGDHTGLSAAMLSRIERGQMFPTLATLLRIALVFGVGLDHFLGPGEEEPVFEVVRARDARQPTAALWGVPAGLAAALAFVLLSYVVTG